MRILLISPTSITFELLNNDSYYTEFYDVYINNHLYIRTNKNVNTIYNLIPNMSYNFKIVLKDRILEKEIKTINKIRKIVKPSLLDDHTKELQEVIDNLKENEFLYLDGIFNIVSLFLKDNTTIELSKGSKLIGSNDRALFPILRGNEKLNGIPLGTWEGRSDDSFSSIITCLGVKNVLIYGEGIIDCNAEEGDWWINHRELRIARRPKGCFIHTSENIIFEGITVSNTPSWNQHPFYSNNLKYLNVKLYNPSNSPTTDGIDPESCSNVDIIGCNISVGDDCIAIKSGKIDFARLYKRASSNITIRNCLMERGHAGVTLGSENSAGINNVNVTNCYFKSTDRGLRIKSQRGRGNLAIIENINFNGIIMEDVKSPFVINAFYKAGNDKIDDRFIRDYQKVSDLTPSFNEFTFKNIKCYDVSYGLGFFLGLLESQIKKIILENIEVSFKSNAQKGEMAMTPWRDLYLHAGIVAENVENIILQNVKFINEPTEKFVVKNVGSIKEL